MSEHEVQIGPDRYLLAGVYGDGTLWARVLDGRWPEDENAVLEVPDAGNPDTLTRTLAEYSVDVPKDLQDALWRDQRNARARMVAQDPEARKKAEAVVERVSRHLGLLSEALSLPPAKNYQGERTVTDPERKRAA